MTDAIAAWYASLAGHLRRREPPALAVLDPVGLIRAATGPAVVDRPGLGYCLLTVEEHLRHLVLHQAEVLEPADRVSVLRARAWWH